ncbi:MAG: LysE family transporter [Bacteroidetes bacterium]|nr:LysE family transporter [Bacteroidota bacterium]
MSLLAGIFIGFLLALPPGGIVLVGLNLSMTTGFRRAVPYAYGTMLVDICYALLAIFGARAVIDFHARSMAEFPVLVIGLQILIVAGLLGYGSWLIIRRTPFIERNAEGGFTVKTGVSRSSRRGPFLLGLGLNLSNIFSPTFLAALAILASQAHALGVLEGDTMSSVLYAVGFGIGNTIYMQIGMQLVAKYVRRLEDVHILRIQKVAGAAFAAIGCMLLVFVVQQ